MSDSDILKIPDEGSVSDSKKLKRATSVSVSVRKKIIEILKVRCIAATNTPLVGDLQGPLVGDLKGNT
jgi:hypothetical protein